MAATLLLGSAFLASPVVEAAKKKPRGLGSAIVACPGSVSGYKLDEVKASADNHRQSCHYRQHKKPGWVRLSVAWYVDEPGERDRCNSRQPQLVDLDGFDGLSWWLESSTKRVTGSISMSDQAKASLADAEAQLRPLIAAAEPLAHPCVPASPAVPSEGLSCPLLLTGELVRTDWYHGESQAVEPLGDGSDSRYGLYCTYLPAFAEDGDSVFVRLEWKEGDPGGYTICTAKVTERYHSTKHQLGYHPVSVEIGNEFVERWGGEALADALVAAAAMRTQSCPNAPDGPAPYADAKPPSTADPATGSPTDAAPTVTSVVISGGPGDEPPAVSSTIGLPKNDQHDIVVGGLEGEVIREQFIGDHGTISGYGPIASDADGNWSALVTLEVGSAPGAAPGATPEVTPGPTPGPSPDPPAPEPIAEPPEAPIAVGNDSPENVDPATEANKAPEVPPPADDEPPAWLLEVPEEVSSDLADKRAGVVRNLVDHVMVLGETLEAEGGGELVIPASDIASLQVLKPKLVKSVRPGSGSIIVELGKGELTTEVYVTPIIGKDGLVEVRLGHFEYLRTNAVVRALLSTLNGYVTERGGRFRTISVTPEGITIMVEGVTPE